MEFSQAFREGVGMLLCFLILFAVCSIPAWPSDWIDY